MDRRLIAIVVIVFSLASFAVWRTSGQGTSGQGFDWGKPTDWLLIGLNSLLALFTLLLWISTDKLWKAGERQIDVAMKAAMAAERSAATAEAALLGAEAPFIFATAEKWKDGDPLAPGERPGFASITLHNHGRSPAIVRDFYPGTIRCTGMPEPISYPPPHSALHRDEIIPAGKSNDPWWFAEGAFLGFAAENDPQAAYWIIGQVRYTDPAGAQYVTGFCFGFHPLGQRFNAWGGAPYNYRRRLSDAEIRAAEASDMELPMRRGEQRT